MRKPIPDRYVFYDDDNSNDGDESNESWGREENQNKKRRLSKENCNL